MSLRKTRLYAFSTGFYFVTIALVLQFITVGISMISDRYSYLPYAGLSLIPASLIANSSKTKRTLLLINFCLFYYYADGSFKTGRSWFGEIQKLCGLR